MITEEDQLTDDSTMPFGKYRGRKMSAVPANYFNWLWCECDYKHKWDTHNVADYIKRNLLGLKADEPDLIWE